MLFISCNNEEFTNRETLSNKRNLMYLDSDLQEYNLNFLSNMPKNQTRGWGRWAVVGLADWGGCEIGAKIGVLGGPKGVVAGAIVVGAFASIATAVSNNYTVPEKIPTISNLNNEYNIVGEQHNKIMDILYKEKNLFYVNGQIDSVYLFNRIQDILIDEGFDVLTIKSINSSIIYDKTFKEVAFVDKNESFDELAISKRIDILVKTFPEKKENYKILENYLITSSMIYKNEKLLDSYTKGYEDIVVRSNINEIDKSMILSTTALTKNSLILW